MKFLKIFLILFFAVIATGYCILFTKPGNNFIRPYLESIAREKINTRILITSFSLTPGSLDLQANLDSLSFNVNGKFNIFTLSLEGVYNLDIEKLEDLEQIIKRKLRGNLTTAGTFKGNKKKLNIDGKGSFRGSACRTRRNPG